MSTSVLTSPDRLLSRLFSTPLARSTRPRLVNRAQRHSLFSCLATLAFGWKFLSRWKCLASSSFSAPSWPMVYACPPAQPLASLPAKHDSRPAARLSSDRRGTQSRTRSWLATGCRRSPPAAGVALCASDAPAAHWSRIGVAGGRCVTALRACGCRALLQPAHCSSPFIAVQS